MGRRVKVLLIVSFGLIGVLFVVSMNYWRILKFVINRPIRKQIEISFEQSEAKLYFNSYAEGLNHNIRSISAFPDNDQANENTDFVFTSDLEIFYEVIGDTLKVYTLIRSPTPAKFKSSIIVDQIKLSNPEYMNLYDKMEELGLKIF